MRSRHCPARQRNDDPHAPRTMRATITVPKSQGHIHAQHPRQQQGQADALSTAPSPPSCPVHNAIGRQRTCPPPAGSGHSLLSIWSIAA